MDELEIQGKKYISSKRASELTGYAKDYIGQMARSGKIPGMRMGRAWYVEKAVLLGSDKPHEGGTLKESPIQREDLPTQTAAAVFQAKKPLLQSTFSGFRYLQKPLPNTWSEVKYEQDERSLMPLVSEKASMLNSPLFEPKNKDFQDFLGRELRIRVLRDTLKPYKAGLSGQNLVRKALNIRDKRAKMHISRAALSFAALSAALGLFIVLSSGVFLSSETVFIGGKAGYTASVLVGFDYIRDMIDKFPPFQTGIEALGAFFKVLSSSFSDFLERGVQFILSIFRLA